MAKMKVHELAKELDKQSKELIAFLKEKGVEVKVAQSSIEGDAIELVRNHFGNKSTETKQEKSTKPSTEKNTDTSIEETDIKKAEIKTEKPAAAAPKKKKNIIFVSNPHNSKMQGQRTRQQSNDKRQNASTAGNTRQGALNRQDKSAPHRPIKPLTDRKSTRLNSSH